MGDRLPKKPNAVAASARVLTATRRDAPHQQPWQAEAWGFRHSVGELRSAETWLGNSMSRANLIAARQETPGANPTPLPENHPASQAMAELAGGVPGQSQMLRQFAAHLMTPGVGYLVGEPTPQGATHYSVVSSHQLALSNPGPNSSGYKLRTGDDASQFRDLPPGTLVVEVLRSDPEFSWRPDSPVRGALPILRELVLLSKHVEATATSRLAGAGVLAMDSSIQFEETWPAFVKELTETITKPITDRDSAAAYAPYPLKVAVPNGKTVKDMMVHLMFNTPFDEHAVKLRDEQLSRLATAMDMPTPLLKGEPENHWGKWATAEEGLTIHIEPALALVADGLTKGYLHPAMIANQNRAQVQRDPGGLIQLVREPERVLSEDDRDIIVWYDVSELETRPDKSEDVKDAYDRWEATGDMLRRELGIADGEAPDGDEFERRVWLELLKHPDAAMEAAVQLGVMTPERAAELRKINAPAPSGAPAGPDDDSSDPQDRSLPDTEGAPPPRRIEPPQQAAAALDRAVVVACDALVHRALEKVGNRLRSKVRGRTGTPVDAHLDQPAILMHTVLNAAGVDDLTSLLAGAWDRLADLAPRLGVEPAPLAATLDGYCRWLLRTRRPHSWESLENALEAAQRAAAGTAA